MASFQAFLRAHRRGAIEWLGVLVVAALVAIGLRSFVVQTFYVPSGSMLPTLQIGDRILVEKIYGPIHRGDILVFRRVPADHTLDADLVKRVIGLPGETISSRNGTIYINGKPLSEPWLPPGVFLGQAITTLKIPPGHYFMMGDNRPISDDSRYWGTVPSSYIVGKVFVVIWRHGHPWFHWF